MGQQGEIAARKGSSYLAGAIEGMGWTGVIGLVSCQRAVQRLYIGVSSTAFGEGLPSAAIVNASTVTTPAGVS